MRIAQQIPRRGAGGSPVTPMRGAVESLNLSLASAGTLAMLFQMASSAFK